MRSYNFYVYITTNPEKTALYIGVTNDLNRRLFEHRENKGNAKTHAGKYYCYNLFYFEHYTHITFAILREKELKKWRREKKNALITACNPEWKFLNTEIED
jgi:putative endonuclease